MPICLAVDIEPDPRQIDRKNPPRWRGFELFAPWFDRLRDDLNLAGHGTVPTSWLLRMDPQIRIAYGDGAWAARTYARQLDSFLERGDEIGLHTHLYRPHDDGVGWIIENEDPAWMELCVREALTAYREAFGIDCRSQSMGDRTLDPRLLEVYEDERVAYDFTVEPGMHAMTRLFPGEDTRGFVPSFEGMPRTPWLPARDDLRRSDPENGYPTIVFPLATFRFPAALELGRRTHQASRRWRNLLVSEDHRLQSWTRVCVTNRPWFFKLALKRALRESPMKALHFVVRSDLPLEPDLLRNAERNIRSLAADPRFCFVTPDEAMQMACPELAIRPTVSDSLHEAAVLG